MGQDLENKWKELALNQSTGILKSVLLNMMMNYCLNALISIDPQMVGGQWKFRGSLAKRGFCIAQVPTLFLFMRVD